MSTQQKIAVVVPSHLEEILLKFISQWQDEMIALDATLYVIEDHQEKSFQFPQSQLKIKHYCWDDYKSDLGENQWIISRRTSAGKSFGFWKAYEDGADVIISLDHDCYPDQENTLRKHVDILKDSVTLRWVTSVGTPTRGFPYEIRDTSPIMVNHGGWSNIPDFDGPQMLQFPTVRFQPMKHEQRVVPYANYFPFCGMNFAFRREATPAMYFLLQGPDWPFDRFDDIWAGIFLKKITDHLNQAITTGYPTIFHEKGTNPFVAVKKEASGLPVNEWFWKAIDEMQLTGKTYGHCYVELAQQLPKSQYVQQSEYKEYFTQLGKAMEIWVALF